MTNFIEMFKVFQIKTSKFKNKFLNNIMGNAFTTAVVNLKDEAQSAITRSKLIDIKSAKSKRDNELAFKIATTRERAHWLITFYATLITFNFARIRFIGEKSFSPLPLAWLPFIGTPFLFMYQLDFAYGTKLSRLNLETKNILKNEKNHWFNEPIRLPKSFQAEYLKMMQEFREKHSEEVANDWAVFVDSMTNEEIYDQVLPATKLVQNWWREL